jgi:hypothetical protein
MTYKTALIVTEALQSMKVLFVSMIHFASGLAHSEDSEAVHALGMRAGIAGTVTPEDRRRLDAIVRDRNRPRSMWPGRNQDPGPSPGPPIPSAYSPL